MRQASTSSNTTKRLKLAALLTGVALGTMVVIPAAHADPGCHGCSYGTTQDGGRTEPEDNRSPGHSESDNDNNNNNRNNNRNRNRNRNTTIEPIEVAAANDDWVSFPPQHLTPPEVVIEGGMGLGRISRDNQGNLFGDIGFSWPSANDE